MEEAAELVNYLPISFKTKNEQDYIFILGLCPTGEGEYTFRSANLACLPSFHYFTGADNLPAR